MSAQAIQSDRILEQLDALWSGLGSEADAEVLRACAMTLILVSEAPADEPAVAETLATVVQDHPSRAIAVAVTEDPGRRLSAAVSARCWLPFGRRQQICCEQIDIAATSGALSDLPPVLTALTAADLPVVVWVRSWRRLGDAALVPLLRLADKLILDSAGARQAAGALEELQSLAALAPLVADLSWTRLTPWRAAIAEAFDQPECRPYLTAVDRIEIRHEGDAITPGALYLAAWLAEAFRQAPIRLAPALPQFGEGVQSVALEGPGLALSLHRNAGGALELHNHGRLIRSFAGPQSEAQLLTEELALLERDPIFETALRRALARHCYFVSDPAK